MLQAVPLRIVATHTVWLSTAKTAALGSALLLLVASVALPALGARRDLGWIAYRDALFGFGFDYPTVIFKPAEGDPTAGIAGNRRRSGQVFRSEDGRAHLLTAAFEVAGRVDLSAYKDRVISTTYKTARVEYERVASDYFVLSGSRGNEVFYERVLVSCGGRIMTAWTMTYPRAEGQLYDRIVEEIARTFRPVEGAGCS